jgi:large subunit ribosomal protein L6
LRLKVGFSHDLVFQIPDSIRLFLIEPTLICLYGIDKNQVTQIASKIREIQPPSVYKGKGIAFSEEVVILKQGKRK